MDFLSSKRVWVDSFTYEKLDKLFQIGRGLISRDRIYKSIIDEWIKCDGPTRIGNINLDMCIQKRYCIWILIDDNLWNDFKYLCSIKELDISVGFRSAIYYFWDLVINSGEVILMQLFLY